MSVRPVSSILLFFCLPLAAQIGGGTSQGTITDPSGGVVPGASVAAQNVATVFAHNVARLSLAHAMGGVAENRSRFLKLQ